MAVGGGCASGSRSGSRAGCARGSASERGEEESLGARQGGGTRTWTIEAIVRVGRACFTYIKNWGNCACRPGRVLRTWAIEAIVYVGPGRVFVCKLFVKTAPESPFCILLISFFNFIFVLVIVLGCYWIFFSKLSENESVISQ